MRVLGLDLGTVTLGVAVSDLLGMLARPLVTLRFENEDYASAIKQILPIIKEQGIKTIVLGLPKHMNNSIGISAVRSQEFKILLEEAADVEVILVDERLSTVAAQRQLIAADVSRKKRKQVIDQMAAVHILQGYLDRK
ncbi:MAG: Holliday junction resolvase RuvX [Erysipelotrichales bacterium]|nr:MAG: Holliday junction resolvase RuvX [Erysipelotrichales bacterium]